MADLEKNIHLFSGSDGFTMREVLREEKAAMLNGNQEADIVDFDFAGSERRSDLEEQAMAALRTGSLFSSAKLTVVRDYWSTQRRASAKAENPAPPQKAAQRAGFEEKLFAYLESMPQGDLIFFLESHVLDKRSRAYKFFSQASKENKVEQRDFPLPLGFKFNLWLEERIKKQGGIIRKPEIELLALLLGRGMEQKERSGEVVAAYDLYQAAQEIDKLIAYADGRPVSREDVLLLVPSSSDLNIFDLIESIARHDKRRALSLLSGQISSGANENYLLTMLVYHFRNLITVKSLLEGGLDRGEIVRRSRLHPLVVEKSMNSARDLSLEQLEMIYDKLYGADLAIKTGRMEPQLALDLLVAAI